MPMSPWPLWWKAESADAVPALLVTLMVSRSWAQVSRISAVRVVACSVTLVSASWTMLWFALAGEGDGEPGVPERGGQVGELGKTGGGWRGLVRTVRVAQQADGRPELSHGRRGGAGELCGDLLRLLGVGVRCAEYGTRLHVGQDEVMGDDVVQVAGDAQALLGAPVSRFLLPGMFRVFGAGPHGLRMHRAQSAGGAERGRQQQPCGRTDQFEDQWFVSGAHPRPRPPRRSAPPWQLPGPSTEPLKPRPRTTSRQEEQSAQSPP